MELRDFFAQDNMTGKWYCLRCSADVHDMKQHYMWHHSVDTTTTVKVNNNVHTRP